MSFSWKSADWGRLTPSHTPIRTSWSTSFIWVTMDYKMISTYLHLWKFVNSCNSMLPPNKHPASGQQFALLGETAPDQHSLPTPPPTPPLLQAINSAVCFYCTCWVVVSSSLGQTLLVILLFCNLFLFNSANSDSNYENDFSLSSLYRSLCEGL